MYTIVIPDLHGMYELLLKAIVKVDEFEGGGHKLIFLGDYIDRGPDSNLVVSKVRELQKNEGAIALKGNHEDMMSACFDENGYLGDIGYWIPNGGQEAINSYSTLVGWGSVADYSAMASDATWMRGLPLYHEDEHRVYVHAAVDPTLDLDDPLQGQIMIWERYYGHEGGWRSKHVVHGHTPKKKVELLPQRTNLDTGAVFGGPLSVGVFRNDTPGGPVDIWEIT